MCQNPHSRSYVSPSPASLVSSTELMTSHQVVLYNICASESHYIISRFGDYLLLYLSSSYISVKLSSAETQTPRDCHSFQRSSPSTNTMSLLITYTACIGDATYNSCSVNTCKMKGFHMENREIKNSTC